MPSPVMKLNRENDNTPIAIPKSSIVAMGPRPSGPGTRVELSSGNPIDVAQTLDLVLEQFEAVD